MADEETKVEKEKGSKFDTIKIILIGVLVFVITLGASYFVLRSTISPLLPKEEAKEEGKSATLGTPFEVGEFTTNIGDVSGTRFMKAKISLTISDSDKKNIEEVTKYKAVVRDRILTIISSKTVADLDPRNRNNLREEIKKDLNTTLGKNMVLNVYFEELIVQ